MHPEFTSQMATQHIAELRRRADHERLLRELRSSQTGSPRRRRLRPRLRPVLTGSGHTLA